MIIYEDIYNSILMFNKNWFLVKILNIFFIIKSIFVDRDRCQMREQKCCALILFKSI